MSGSHCHNADYLPQEELARLGFATLGKNVRIHVTCVLVNCQQIAIGDHVRIDPFCVLSPGDHLMIGSYIHISAHCTIAGSSPISLGDFSTMSHGAKILSASDDFRGGCLIGPTVPDIYRNVDSRLVRLERHALIGAGTLLLPGSTLGEGAAVGSMSVVKGDLAPWTLHAGCPARKVGDRDRDGALDAERRFLASLAHVQE